MMKTPNAPFLFVASGFCLLPTLLVLLAFGYLWATDAGEKELLAILPPILAISRPLVLTTRLMALVLMAAGFARVAADKGMQNKRLQVDAPASRH